MAYLLHIYWSNTGADLILAALLCKQGGCIQGSAVPEYGQNHGLFIRCFMDEKDALVFDPIECDFGLNSIYLVFFWFKYDLGQKY